MGYDHMNIRTLLKDATQVLLTDDEFFHKDMMGIKSLEDIKELLGIRGRLVKGDYYSNKIQYKLVNSDYSFTLTIIN